jgi:alanine racemase
MPRPISAIIDASALRANLRRVRERVRAARVWAVVKANAYGHGLIEAMQAFSEADGLALVEFDGASRLREAGCTKPILMLEGAFDSRDVTQASEQQLTLVVHSSDQVEWLAAHRGARIDTYLKINTGMHRLGVEAASVRDFVARLEALAAIRSVALMTHFANADLRDGARAQIDAFDRVVREVDDAGRSLSLANSSAILDLPETHRDWVRPGIMLYGASPFADRSARDLGLRAAMSLQSRIIGVQSLKPGDAVGYGSTFVADRPMRIGIVACGYADGYPRHAPSGTPIAVSGVRTGTVGRVSMDMLAVDLTGIEHASLGSEVELWGESIPVDEVARHAGTIGYELLCAVAPRVPRKILDDGPATENPLRL